MRSISKNKEEPFMIGVRETDNLKSRDIILNERSPKVYARIIFGNINHKGLFGKTKLAGYIEISLSDKMIDAEKYPLLHTRAIFKLSYNLDKIIRHLKKEIIGIEVENESKNGINMQKPSKEMGVSEEEFRELYKIIKILKSDDSEDEKMISLIEATRYYIELVKKKGTSD